jgi:hypothetical protein
MELYFRNVGMIMQKNVVQASRLWLRTELKIGETPVPH